jgi:hypothetical protein
LKRATKVAGMGCVMEMSVALYTQQTTCSCQLRVTTYQSSNVFPTKLKKAEITAEQMKETCDVRLNANPRAWHQPKFPELTTRFVAITPLSDSWDAQANRSCNRLSESLLAKTIAHHASQIQRLL